MAIGYLVGLLSSAVSHLLHALRKLTAVACQTRTGLVFQEISHAAVSAHVVATCPQKCSSYYSGRVREKLQAASLDKMRMAIVLAEFAVLTSYPPPVQIRTLQQKTISGKVGSFADAQPQGASKNDRRPRRRWCPGELQPSSQEIGSS